MPHNYPVDQFAAGLQRAKARRAPKGFEGQSQWQADLSGIDDTLLMINYKQRERDRLEAQRRADREQFYSTPGSGPLVPFTQPGYAMEGFAEGLQFNDVALGAKKHKIMSPEELTPSLDDNSAYAMMALREFASPKRKKKR